VKDLIVTRGWPTLRGSRTVDPLQPWTEDAPPVARLREAGAVFMGKTTTSEFGWKGVTDSPLTGLTRNPLDSGLTPGGSSGGAAVACALGMGMLHLATDGGGSIRIPAAFCGLFGFKPTFGVVPVHPRPTAGSLWHQGPIARTVDDAAIMLDTIAKPDRRDAQHGPALDLDFFAPADRGVLDLRIAYSETLGYARVDRQVADRVAAVAQRLRSLGAHVDLVNPGLEDPIRVMQPLWSVAVAMGIAPLDDERRALVDPPLLDLAEQGARLDALAYRRLENEREAIARQLLAVHADYDLLMTPQVPITAFEAGHEVPPGRGMTRWWEWSPFTYPFNLTQQPCATVPCGRTDAGLPVAAQLVGARFDDARVLRAARALEAACPFERPAVA
jgi:aspartyl-tRNA(Asn)/glutamyl-tRNA(Gln) amidotransferase subunit A